jgi:hypothetical protein
MPAALLDDAVLHALTVTMPHAALHNIEAILLEYLTLFYRNDLVHDLGWFRKIHQMQPIGLIMAVE